MNRELPQLLPSAQHWSYQAGPVLPTKSPCGAQDQSPSAAKSRAVEPSSYHTTLMPSAGDTAASGCNSGDAQLSPTQPLVACMQSCSTAFWSPCSSCARRFPSSLSSCLKQSIVLSNIAVLNSRQLIQCCVGLTLLASPTLQLLPL